MRFKVLLISILFFNFVFAQESFENIPGITMNSEGEWDKYQLLKSLEYSYTDTEAEEIENHNDVKIQWLIDDNEVLVAKRFEKLELGLDFITPKVKMKVDAYMAKKSGEQTLNPFDRGDIEIVAEFYRYYPTLSKWLGPVKREAFYFQNYKRNFVERDKEYSGWFPITTKNPYRIRFTPRETGTWASVITVKIKGEVLVQSSFRFWVEPTENKNAFDFVTKSEKNNYFKTTDNHGADKTYFPIGQNLPTPTCFDCEDVPCAGIEAYCGGLKHIPVLPYAYLRYQKEVEELAQKGGNTYRLLFAPYNYSIEFEKVNDYSGRLHCAWEMDKLLDKTKDLNLRILLNLQIHYVFDYPNVYGQTMWDWPNENDEVGCPYEGDPGNGYRNDLNLKEPIEFFTSNKAKYHYKNKLRYYVARYGYSPNISMLELVSEINGFGAKPLMELETNNGNVGCVYQGKPWGDSYYGRDSVPGIINDWQREMLGYIKNELGHQDQLMEASYAGYPYDDSTQNNYGGANIVAGDSTYYSEDLDVLSFNFYSNSVEKFKALVTWSNKYKKTIDKPLLISEIGTSENYRFCDSNLNFKNVVTLSPFTGFSGMSMNWNFYHNEDDLWKHYQFMSDFFEDIDLIGQSYVPYSMENKSSTAMVFYQENEDVRGDIFGVANNQTVNYFTKSTGEPCSNINAVLPNREAFKSLQQVNSIKEFAFKRLGAFKSYQVTYYYPLTGKQISSEEQRSGLFGTLKLKLPTLDSLIDYSKVVFRITPIVENDDIEKVKSTNNYLVYKSFSEQIESSDLNKIIKGAENINVNTRIKDDLVLVNKDGSWEFNEDPELIEKVYLIDENGNIGGVLNVESGKWILEKGTLDAKNYFAIIQNKDQSIREKATITVKK